MNTSPHARPILEPRVRPPPPTHRWTNDYGRGRRFHRHRTSSRHRRRHRTRRTRCHPQLRARRLHQLDRCPRPRRTRQHSSRRRFLRRLWRPLPQPLGRFHFPRRLLARHRRLHRCRDGRLRHLHAALFPARTRHPLGFRLFRVPARHQLPSRPQLWALRILVCHDQGRRHRHLHRTRRRPASHRTRRPAIRRSRWILPARTHRPAARHHLRHLHLR